MTGLGDGDRDLEVHAGNPRYEMSPCHPSRAPGDS